VTQVAPHTSCFANDPKEIIIRVQGPQISRVCTQETSPSIETCSKEHGLPLGFILTVVLDKTSIALVAKQQGAIPIMWRSAIQSLR
jgi:hypothetical protein